MRTLTHEQYELMRKAQEANRLQLAIVELAAYTLEASGELPPPPKGITEPRWRAMVQYYINRCGETS